MRRTEISKIVFSPAPRMLRATGLLGWVALRYGELMLDEIGVRRTSDGRHVLSFPRGRYRSVIRPADQQVRDDITEELIAELRRRRAIP